MPTFTIDLRRPPKDIHPIGLVEDGRHPNGDQIGFTNYYMELNGRPFFGVCGEFHYSRYPYHEWEAEIIKMKLGGVNIVSSYVFWIHHEEDPGQFRWDGDLNLRYFVDLCAKHGMYAIVRVGPFAHGECRNGGLPDWLYGRPFELRSNDPAYLAYVRRLYGEIGRQLRGQFYQDGGPIIAIQLENEYMHTGAPWEVVPKQTEERITSGADGAEHMRVLKEIAREAGLAAPFYTSTGWGGAPVLEGEILPLYGGYAFCPWNVDAQRPTHAPTAEYLFQSFHDNAARCAGFDPPYPPEAYPFACCEMGGGMQVWYQYRFIVPPVSVEAMALVKIAGGCNFVGYYMYHGGSNPVGRHGYMNEHVTPKISYDFQAPLGEFGQVRESYRALRLLHLFASEFAAQLCPTATVLPDGNAAITPADGGTLRFAARVHGDSGFLFLNNYQDHAELHDHHGIRFELELGDQTLTIPRDSLTLQRDVCAILPFNLDLNGARLVYATTQLVTQIEHAGETVYFCFAPEGMAAEYCFERASLAGIAAEGATIEHAGQRTFASAEPGAGCLIRLRTAAGNAVTICTLTRQEALQLNKVRLWGRERIVLSNADLLINNGALDLLVTGNPDVQISLFPDVAGGLAGPDGPLDRADGGLFASYRLALPAVAIPLILTQISDASVSVRLPAGAVGDIADILLAIRYRGDVGYASVDGRLISDNFANGAPWEIGLGQLAPRIYDRDIDIYISPLREGRVVASDSAMAAQQSFVGQAIAEITAIEALPRRRVRIAHML
jgi:hypothetical protein